MPNIEESTSRRGSPSVVQHLAMIAGGANWNAVTLGMFTAYFDASGKRDQPAIVVAGFLARADAWIEWERCWLSRLAVDGLEYFHATELSGLGESKSKSLIDDLCLIIREHVSLKTGVAVINKQVNTIFSEYERKQWRMHAYAHGGRTVAAAMRMWAAEWSGPLPELVFERGDEGTGYLQDLLKAHGYPAPIFKPKKLFTHPKTGIIEKPAIPLQAADLLAHEVFVRIREFLNTGTVSKDRERLPIELHKIVGEWGIVEPDRLKLLKAAMEQRDPDILIPNVKIKTS